MNLRLEMMEVEGRPARGTRVFAPGTVVLGRGRGPEVTVHLADAHASRRHCQIEARPSEAGAPTWWVSDLGSQTGVLLNGRCVREPSRLRAGDVLRLSHTTILVELGAAPDVPCAGCGHQLTEGMAHGRRRVCDACLRGDGKLARRFGEWVEVTEVGVGTYGHVLLAAGKHGRLAALKVAQADPFSDPLDACENGARFRRETEILASLDHPSLPRVYGAGTTEDAWWVAMELMEEDLQRFVEREGPLDPLLATRLGIELLRGLGHCHAHGVLHRDVKPKNVLLSVDGVVRLADFGLCIGPGLTRVTGSREGMGTLRFAAPEQMTNAHRADARSDIYAWGATLHFLLTGRPPFWWARSFADVLQAIVAIDAPRLDHESPEVPPELARVVTRAMACDPNRRYQDTREVIQELESLAGAAAG